MLGFAQADSVDGGVLDSFMHEALWEFGCCEMIGHPSPAWQAPV